MLWLAAIALALSACQAPRGRSASGSPNEIQALIDRQVREWNAGNLAGFMETYARSERMRFASGGEVVFGWQAAFDRYRNRYGDRAAMGTLRFSDVDITLLADDAALVFGRWHLKRASDEPSGLFSLILCKLPEGWRIVHDHTSAANSR